VFDYDNTEMEAGDRSMPQGAISDHSGQKSLSASWSPFNIVSPLVLVGAADFTVSREAWAGKARQLRLARSLQRGVPLRGVTNRRIGLIQRRLGTMKHTILFVDDERAVRQYCKQELEAAGFRVVLAQDGEDAIDALNCAKVDLVVLDEDMPRLGGLEAATHVKRFHPDLPVILFTPDTDYESYHSRFVEATIIKSDRLEALKETINQLLPPAPFESSQAVLARVDVQCH
jgi:CheY-like chemotaxis protein